MKSKMTANPQLSTNEPKKIRERKPTKTKTKPTTTTGTESEKWRSHRGLSTGEWDGERGGKGTENK